MKSIVLGLMLAGACTSAHAGFLTGFAVGSALSSGPGKKTPVSQLVASDSHDVIMCEKAPKGEACSDDIRDASSGRFIRYITPEEYAIRAGYRVVQKKAVLLAENRIYIVMEVAMKTLGSAAAK